LTVYQGSPTLELELERSRHRYAIVEDVLWRFICAGCTTVCGWRSTDRPRAVAVNEDATPRGGTERSTCEPTVEVATPSSSTPCQAHRRN